jgi:hypothetical protein
MHDNPQAYFFLQNKNSRLEREEETQNQRKRSLGKPLRKCKDFAFYYQEQFIYS